MDGAALGAFIDDQWEREIVPKLVEYVKILNKSPLFDPHWAEEGHMHAAVDLVAGWCRAQPIEGLQVEVLEHPGRTPVIFMDIPGHSDAGDETVLLYGHLDKQPEMAGWDEDLGPWKPVLRDDKLYGRGGADDGYSAFAALTAIAALQKQSIPHARCVVLIEASEESGSPDLPYYIDALADRLGQVGLVVCLDSGCGDYERLWSTTSLRGLVVGDLRIEILREGVNSGDACGIVPSSFRIARLLLSRLEDEYSGYIRVASLQVEIPEERRAQAQGVVEALGERVVADHPFVEGARAQGADLTELVLNRTWRPALSVTGADGLPPLRDAGNVLRPFTSLRVSLRLPPTLDATLALDTVKHVVETEPPFGARVSFLGQSAGGWNAPELSPWLASALDQASLAHFEKPAAFMGEGGSIPFMGMLGERFPEAQFLVTGVLGPGSNAHGPNEFLHIPTGKRLTACVARVLGAHLRHLRAERD